MNLNEYKHSAGEMTIWTAFESFTTFTRVLVFLPLQLMLVFFGVSFLLILLLA